MKHLVAGSMQYSCHCKMALNAMSTQTPAVRKLKKAPLSEESSTLPMSGADVFGHPAWQGEHLRRHG